MTRVLASRLDGSIAPGGGCDGLGVSCVGAWSSHTTDTTDTTDTTGTDGHARVCTDTGTGTDTGTDVWGRHGHVRAGQPDRV